MRSKAPLWDREAGVWMRTWFDGARPKRAEMGRRRRRRVRRTWSPAAPANPVPTTISRGAEKTVA